MALPLRLVKLADSDIYKFVSSHPCQGSYKITVWRASAADCPNLEVCRLASDSQPACGYREREKTYVLFKNHCLLDEHNKCNKDESYFPAELKLCVQHDYPNTRRVYGESCPMFCPEHYRPVCGASKLMDYKYRAFKNGCYLDMLNCRGEEVFSGYVEVPLSFCSKHPMKNIWSEKIVISG